MSNSYPPRNAASLVVGGRYNWKNQPERLVYIGHNWSGNGYWHQFERVDEPGRVWCEVLGEQLSCFEETKTEALATSAAEDDLWAGDDMMGSSS